MVWKSIRETGATSARRGRLGGGDGESRWKKRPLPGEGKLSNCAAHCNTIFSKTRWVHYGWFCPSRGKGLDSGLHHTLTLAFALTRSFPLGRKEMVERPCLRALACYRTTSLGPLRCFSLFPMRV